MRDYTNIVQGLLAKAQSTQFPDEAESLMAKATELMAKHAIDEAMDAAERGQPEEVTRVNLTCYAPYATGKVVLLTAIAKANSCRAIQVTDRGDHQVHVFGHAADIKHVKALYITLSLHATRQMLRQAAKDRRFRHAFMVSYAARIRQRLGEARAAGRAQWEAENPESTGVALVLVDRDLAVDAAVRDEYPMAAKRRVSVTSMTGYTAGAAAANNADLGQRRVAGRAALPS